MKKQLVLASKKLLLAILGMIAIAIVIFLHIMCLISAFMALAGYEQEFHWSMLVILPLVGFFWGIVITQIMEGPR